MFWRKTPDPMKAMRVIKINKLTVRTQDGTTLSWAVDDWKGTIRIEPWIAFYKWFFGRNSDTFVMRSDWEETMLRRSDIVRFTVHVHTKMVDASA